MSEIIRSEQALYCKPRHCGSSRRIESPFLIHLLELKFFSLKIGSSHGDTPNNMLSISRKIDLWYGMVDRHSLHAVSQLKKDIKQWSMFQV